MRWRHAHPERNWRRYLALYGITPERYDEMSDKQGGLCAICHKPCSTGMRFSVDHDHRHCSTVGSCGKCVRGLLCRSCNVGIGNLKDDPIIVDAAAAYLRRYEVTK